VTTVPDQRDQGFEPRFPTLVATGLLSFWIAILSLPLWTGRFLAGPYSDQYHSGYAFRDWLAQEWKRTGAIPLWNPELFGGLPFVGAMHGDIFYPTAWLRLVLPTGFAMGLGFVVHYVLAGLFVYLLLRLLRTSWAGAVAGGAAYQLSGVIGSYVQPGHDGKLFVTTLLPLALIGLVLGMRDRRPAGYGLVALSVGLALLSPHAQMTYYLLVAAGIFALYLTFGETDARPLAGRLAGLGFALLAVAVGFGIGMIQILPFMAYLPFSPRADTYYGFEGATSYAIPWTHVPEFFLAGFTGTTQDGTYWATNPLKLHSEYFGLTAVALAVVGVADRARRRLVLWLGGVAFLFLLICLGAGTPFYRIWWQVMPFMQKVRAPGMALYVVALVVALFAGFGVHRIERGEARRWGTAWLVAGAIVVLLAAVGAVGGLAESLARGIELEQGRAVTDAAGAAQGAIRTGALLSGLALIALGALAWAAHRGRVPAIGLALALPLLVSADLWQNARAFWDYTEDPRTGLYGGDAITETLRTRTGPSRVLDLSDTGVEVYPGASLMAYRIPQLLGHHGNQLHHFNELLGGKNQWRYLLSSRRLWDLYAVEFVLLPSGTDLGTQLPAYANLGADFDTAMAGVPTARGRPADLLVRRTPMPYARLVPAAIKLPDDRAVPTVADPRSGLPFDRLVLLDTAAALVPAPVDSLPPPLDARVEVEAWEPGAMRLRVEPAAPDAGYVLVAENFYPDWHAMVDGHETTVLRGDASLLAVPVSRGARDVTLRFRSADYERGRAITWVSLLIVAAVFAAPLATRRLRARRQRH